MPRLLFASVLGFAMFLGLNARAVDGNHWHVSDYYAANLNGHGPGNLAMWCGDSTLVSCAPVDSIGGFGNNWFDDLVWSQPAPDPAESVTVQITGWMNYDLPDETWDWVFPIVMRNGVAEELAEYTGADVDNLYFDFTTVVGPEDFVGPDGDRVELRFRVTSDGAWSDIDCFMPSRGAAQIDDVTVLFDGEVVTFDDFEAGSPVHWTPLDPSVVAIPAAPTRLAAWAEPNPFNPSTRIVFDLPRDGRVTIRIHDERGRLVRRLIDARRDSGPGAVTWNGRDEHGELVASGVYFYVVTVPGERQVGKLALVK